MSRRGGVTAARTFRFSLVRVGSVDVDGRSLCEGVAERAVRRGDGPGLADDRDRSRIVAGRAERRADIRGSLCVLACPRNVEARGRAVAVARIGVPRRTRLDWFPTELGQLGLLAGRVLPNRARRLLVGSPSCRRLNQRLRSSGAGPSDRRGEVMGLRCRRCRRRCCRSG